MRLAAWLVALVSAAVGVPGGEDADVRAFMRRYDAVNREIEATLTELDTPRPAGDHATRVLSLRRNGVVTVGGEVRTTYTGVRSNFISPDTGSPDPFTASSPLGTGKLGSLAVTRANLSVDVALTDRWHGFLELQLTDHNNLYPTSQFVNRNQGAPSATPSYQRVELIDPVHAAYVEYRKAGHSGFGFKLGAFQLPFGLTSRPDLPAYSYMDAPDLEGSFLMDPLGREGYVRLPHASRSLDPVVAAMITYELRDIIHFEAAVFQERNANMEYRVNGYGATPKYGSDSSLPRSYHVAASFLPLEGWELSLAFRNRNSRTRGIHYWANSPYRGDFSYGLASGARDPRWDSIVGQWSDTGDGVAFGSTTNEQAFALGLAVEIPNTKLAVTLEYAHGWNQGFNRHVSSDGVNLGLTYRLTPRLTLIGQGEWLYVRDGSWLVPGAWGGTVRDSRANKLYRLLAGLEYELAKGLTLEGGFQYEYWRFSSAAGGAGMQRLDRTLTAKTLYLGTRFLF